MTAILMLMALGAKANDGGGCRVVEPQVRSLTAVVNGDWTQTMRVLRLGSSDRLEIGFDELSHETHRYTWHLSHCEADWTPSEDIFESDFLEGFNDQPIDDYETSVNTTVGYTHYSMTMPNDRCQLKMSGNYRLTITDDERGEDGEVLSVDFMVTEQSMTLQMSMTTNTDIDLNQRHQQVEIALNYGRTTVTQPSEQLQTVVMQNGQRETARENVRPSFNTVNGLTWQHARDLIFKAGNEYRKFELLDPSHTTMGLDRVRWDGSRFHAWPFVDAPRPNYLFDKDANGAFLIRNSDNSEVDVTSDYVVVNYRLRTPATPELLGPSRHIVVDGRWTTSVDRSRYAMTYNAETGLYEAQILQKQGYYNYRYMVWDSLSGELTALPSEGDHYQTENEYEALVYYRGPGERTWRLTACATLRE